MAGEMKMSPDIEWQVGDEAGQRTIVKTPPKPPAPPTSIPTPTPPPLEAAIDQESQALAGGDLSAFMAMQDTVDDEWVLSQRESFQAWGSAPTGNQLYTVC